MAEAPTLIKRPTTRSPERAALADAIFADRTAEARMAALQEAAGYGGAGHDRARAARARCDAAAEAVGEARAADDRAAADAMVCGSPPPAATAPAAKAEALAAEEEAAAAERALAAVETELQALEHGCRMRASHLRDALAAVVKAETAGAVASLVDGLEQAMALVLDRRAALAAVVDAHGFDPTGEMQRSAAARLVARLDGAPAHWDLDGADQPTTRAWRAALAALAGNADAAFPL